MRLSSSFFVWISRASQYRNFVHLSLSVDALKQLLYVFIVCIQLRRILPNANRALCVVSLQPHVRRENISILGILLPMSFNLGDESHLNVQRFTPALR